MEHDYWGEDPEYLVEDWQFAVVNGDTRSGYWEWVAAERALWADDVAAEE